MDDDKFLVCVHGGSGILEAALAADRDDSSPVCCIPGMRRRHFYEVLAIAHVETFGMVDILSLLEYLMLRMRNATQEIWIMGCETRLRCVDTVRL